MRRKSGSFHKEVLLTLNAEGQDDPVRSRRSLASENLTRGKDSWFTKTSRRCSVLGGWFLTPSHPHVPASGVILGGRDYKGHRKL